MQRMSRRTSIGNPPAVHLPPVATQPTLTVTQLPLSQRPRERLTQLGAEALSEHELLACVLGRGVAGESVLINAQRVLATFGSLRGISGASVEQLSQVHGIGHAKAVQLKAALELARRLSAGDDDPRPVIDSAEAAVALLRPKLQDAKREHFVACLLDNRHRLIRVASIAIGSLSATVVHPRELFNQAIAAHAAAVLVAHNHPSGDPAPSAHDVDLTRRLVEAGELLGIEVLDHVIVGREGAVSLRALGVLGPSPDRLHPTQRRRR